MADPTVRNRVQQEMARFRESLAELLNTHAGLWVVFREGRVCSAHETEQSAFEAGLREFGPDGGHLVIRVEEERATPVTASVVFGVAQ